jgi:hypothetical protein
MPSVYMPDAEVGYVLKPNISFRTAGDSTVDYHINDRGYRVGRPGEKAPSHADVLVVGCSQAYGQSVSYEQTFAAVIGEKLGVSVANLGVSSYGGISSMLLAKRFKDMRPSILVYGFWEDHLYRNVAKCTTSFAPFCVSLPYFSCQKNGCRLNPPGDNAHPMQLTQQYARDLGQGRQSRGFANDLYWTGRLLMQRVLLNTGLADQYVRISDPMLLRTATVAFIDMVVTQAKDLGAVPLLVFIPYYFDDVVHDTPAYVIEAAEAGGVHFVTLTDRFRGEAAANPGHLAIPGDGHLSAAGHRIVAEMVVDHVVKHGLVHNQPRNAMTYAKRPTT